MKYLILLLFSLMIILSSENVYPAAATMYVTPAGANNKDGTDWDNAFSEAEWETDIEGGAEAGDIYYVAGGTYTLDSDISTARVGDSASPVKIIGVASGTTAEPPTFSDWAFGDDRPLIAASTYTWNLDDFWQVYNIRMTTAEANGLDLNDGNYSAVINCKVEQNSETADQTAIYAGSYNHIISCEAISTAGQAIYPKGSGLIMNCYIHDSKNGILAVGYTVFCFANIIDTCSTAGVNLGAYFRWGLVNNTIYNCGTGISGQWGYGDIFINNIIDGCTTGASKSGSKLSDIWDYNCWDNTTDTTNVTKGNNAVTADPGMTAPDDGDFTLGSGSNSLDAGLQVGTNEGATGDYKVNIGADQDDVAAAGTTVQEGAMSLAF